MTHSARQTVRVRKIPRGRRTQPVRHFVLKLTDAQHQILRRASQKMRGFAHPFIRYPDENETIVQGRDADRIMADIRTLFPDIDIDRRVPDAGEYIFNH